MARAYVSSMQEDRIDGDGVVYTAHVRFIGSDLPGGPDSARIEWVIEPGDGAVAIRDKIVAEVNAEAARLGYTLGANSRFMPSYIRV